jgi:hypothetical protein
VLSLVVGMKVKRQTPARTKAAPFLVEAITTGKGSVWLAEAAGIDTRTACELLAEYSGKMASKVEHELGLAVEAMRGVATAERSRVTARLAAVGSVCDSLLETAGLLVAELRAADGSYDGPDGEDTGLERLERLAKVLTSAGKAAESSWKLFRSASGLELAERLTELQAREKLKAGEDQGEVWEADFTLLSPE